MKNFKLGQKVRVVRMSHPKSVFLNGKEATVSGIGPLFGIDPDGDLVEADYQVVTTLGGESLAFMCDSEHLEPIIPLGSWEEIELICDWNPRTSWLDSPGRREQEKVTIER